MLTSKCFRYAQTNFLEFYKIKFSKMNKHYNKKKTIQYFIVTLLLYPEYLSVVRNTNSK